MGRLCGLAFTTEANTMQEPTTRSSTRPRTTRLALVSVLLLLAPTLALAAEPAPATGASGAPARRAGWASLLGAHRHHDPRRRTPSVRGLLSLGGAELRRLRGARPPEPPTREPSRTNRGQDGRRVHRHAGVERAGPLLPLLARHSRPGRALAACRPAQRRHGRRVPHHAP